jgi:hypothetical protein
MSEWIEPLDILLIFLGSATVFSLFKVYQSIVVKAKEIDRLRALPTEQEAGS